MFIVLKKLRWFFAAHWKRYASAIVLLAIAGIIDVIPPKLIGYSIDGIHTGTLSGAELYRLLAWWIALTVIGYSINYVWMYQLFGGAFVLERTLRTGFMKHLLRMTPTFYERNRTGDLMARATNDLRAVSVTAGFGILTLIDSSLFMLTILVTMAALISWKLTLASLLPLPLMAWLMQKFGRRIHERYTRAQDAFGRMNDQVLETIGGVRVIRAFVQEASSQNQFKQMTDEVYEKNRAVAQIDALFDPVVKVLVGVSYLIGLCYGAYLVFHNDITLGELVSFNVFLGMLIWPMLAIGELINIMQRGNASLDRVNETLAYTPDVESADHPAAVGVPHDIEFDNVTFRYPASPTNNLSGISIRLARGQTLGIVGRTGSGKTTLLKQLLREYPAGSGTLAIAGVAADRIALPQLHGWIGYVPQQPVLFSRSIRDNILFGREGAGEQELQQALELASFAKDVQFLPDGLDTLVGEKGVALSGGQKQRVSIARALIADPEILLLDDALSAVDAKTETEIVSGIRRERAGKTTLITTHRLSAVQHADWIVVLDEGRIVEEGKHEQLLQAGGWYKDQYDRQQLEGSTETETGKR
ncbi:ABC transporter ATP-binding protein [Paenibacillus allorhizosphaerae]|uniref:Multidrug resistance ABC transporter ATP-binding/permease protein YheI n=1 Tax=Paenibacillus allorhizosphaerae TaxID=2849866 RepID=A0ABM8VKW4_9BACL|nr:ABC transporter transmembrane domain-containing protein [Paenibacillus allorhizosphaerae]CAG7647508.1 putative multidrug resistance ABC transporter ATP-binding/permease protein YheI [Paenibacillus allorhizosphaerae]